MSETLDGRVALVTGAGRGIGRATALALGDAGARVALVSRTRAELEEVAATLGAAGAETPAVIVADMRDPAQIGEAVRSTVAKLGPAEILVNNAAVVWPLGPTTTLDPLRWEEAFQINVFAVLRLTQEVLPAMLDLGWRRIVNVSSGIVAVPGAMVGANAYVAGKAALEAHSLNLAAELHDTGVTVNAFRPGAVDTAMQGWIRDQDPDEIGDALHARFVERHAAGELISPEQSATALLDHLRAGGTGRIWDVP